MVFTTDITKSNYCGHGVYVAQDGSKYEGNYEKGVPNGKGTFTDVERNIYSGVWKGGKLNGFATIKHVNGDVYEGIVVDNKKEGKGFLKYADGSSYVGDFVNDMRHGHGKLLYPDGIYYEGEWVCDMKHGYGANVINGSGSGLYGNWLNNKPHGKATLKTLGGSILQIDVFDDYIKFVDGTKKVHKVNYDTIFSKKSIIKPKPVKRNVKHVLKKIRRRKNLYPKRSPFI